MFILLWAVSGHHYLTLQRESCKQMLVAHSVVIACVAVAAERTGVVCWCNASIQGCWRLESTGAEVFSGVEVRRENLEMEKKKKTEQRKSAEVKKKEILFLQLALATERRAEL